MTLGAKLILSELMTRPGQSKYLLASHMHVSPVELDAQLEELTRDGTIVRSDVAGDSEPVFWAAKRAEVPFSVS